MVGASVVFVVWCEVWKLMRKRLYKRWERAAVVPEAEKGMKQAHDGGEK